ncbi:MerR family transcriptional regulator [Rhodoblastus sp.]|uniref:MerR family transcriptional regulator n=1 Tax=Rhodoblastus sp. TaxID=1962975 RepID=UPI002616F722|nr:MerR family transcriptional regulator [Rhodoblastus sp.]
MKSSAQRVERLPHREQSLAEMLTIGEIARIYGITLRALRFYEQRGLLKPLRRGGARFYDSTQRTRLQLILKGKHLGFTLSEISGLLDADASAAQPTADFTLDETMVLAQLRHLEGRRTELDQAIEELRATQRRLTGAPD